MQPDKLPAAVLGLTHLAACPVVWTHPRCTVHPPTGLRGTTYLLAAAPRHRRSMPLPIHLHLKIALTIKKGAGSAAMQPVVAAIPPPPAPVPAFRSSGSGPIERQQHTVVDDHPAHRRCAHRRDRATLWTCLDLNQGPLPYVTGQVHLSVSFVGLSWLAGDAGIECTG